jgi:hypothetical protein
MRKAFARRKGCVVAGTLLAVAVAAQLGIAITGWAQVERFRLDREIARLRADGEPTAPVEILSIVPGPNAADEWLAAGASQDRPDAGEDKWFGHANLKLPLTPEQVKHLEAYLRQHQADLDHVTRATTRPGLDWHIQLERPLYLTLLRSLNPQRGLANLLQATAWYHHQNGDDRQAVERVHQIFAQARALSRQPFLVSHLVAVGVAAQGDQTLLPMLPDLRVGSGPTDATPAQLRRLIADLTDDRWRSAGLRRAMQVERIGMLELAELLPAGEGRSAVQFKTPDVVWRVAAPLVYRDARLMLDDYAAYLAAVGNEDWPSAYHQLPKADRWRRVPQLHPFASLTSPDVGRAVLTSFRVTTEQRIFGVLTAIKLYAADHHGDLPPTLDDLVPDYLMEVPADPMSPGGQQPLGYLPDRWAVYSVGEDGVDQHGSDKPAPGARGAGNLWQHEDAVFAAKPK